MRTKEIHIRDPFILAHEGVYYLYSTDSNHGFKVYRSDDLQNWSDPVKVPLLGNEFWESEDFWAPEVHCYQGSFYLFATLNSPKRNRGTQIFRSDSPMGPFSPISAGPITPEEWLCLDGTLYLDPSGVPYMVFCREWLQVHDGEMYYAQLSEDFTHFVTEPKLMLKAHDFDFVEDLTGEEAYITDGPFFHRNAQGDLLMIWSSFGNGRNYFESVLRSDNGEIDGKWLPLPLLFEQNGGHGMLFRDFSGQLMMPLHQPNSPNGAERLHLFLIDECENGLTARPFPAE